MHYKLIAKSRYNKVYDFDCQFDDIDTPTEKERAEIREINSRTDTNYINAGVIAPDEVRDVLRQDSNSGYSALSEEAPDTDIDLDDEDNENGGSSTEQNPFSLDDKDFKESDHPRDKNGQFAKGNSSGGKSATSTNENKSSAPKIAGVPKGKPMTFKQAGAGTNPNYNKNKNDGYFNNCQSCITVFEARMRGYNIQALPYDKKNVFMKALLKHPEIAFTDKKTFDSPKITHLDAINGKECEKWLKDNIKPGQRWVFGYTPNSNDYGGHILIVTKDFLNNLHFYDPQSNKEYDTSSLLSNIKFTNYENGVFKTLYPIAFRIDDKELNNILLNKISKQSS